MKKKKTIKINKKTLARNLLLALVVIALAIVVPQAVKGAVNKGKTEDDSKTAPTYIDLSQYPSLCEFLREKKHRYRKSDKRFGASQKHFLKQSGLRRRALL